MVAAVVHEKPEAAVARLKKNVEWADTELVDLNGTTFGVEEDASGDIGSFSTSRMVLASSYNLHLTQSQLGDEDSLEGKCNDSFIQMDDDDLDLASAQSMDMDSCKLSEASLGIPTLRKTDMSPHFGSGEEKAVSWTKATQARPVVILTSGEKIFPDVVLDSTTVCQSAMLQGDFVGQDDLDILRKDHVYR